MKFRTAWTQRCQELEDRLEARLATAELRRTEASAGDAAGGGVQPTASNNEPDDDKPKAKSRVDIQTATRVREPRKLSSYVKMSFSGRYAIIART